MGQLIHPHSKGKFYWDMIINLLSLMNAIYVPVEISYEIDTPEMEAVNYVMDIIFLIDIVVNFRTIIFDERTSDAITDNRAIAINYIKGGRFFIDLVASLPLEVIGDLSGGTISKGTLKLIGLIKLTRLLRLGKIINFIKVNKSFKHGLRFLLLFIYLFLIIHFIDCAAFYVFSITSNWVPPMDIIQQETTVYEDLTEGYWIMFYYGSLFLMSNDPCPMNTTEIIVCTFFVLLGSITLGLLIGNFSDLINNITKKARVEAEKVDFIHQMMFTLKLPEEIQNRILEYHENINSNALFKGFLGQKKIKILAPSLLQKIYDH